MSGFRNYFPRLCRKHSFRFKVVKISFINIYSIWKPGTTRLFVLVYDQLPLAITLSVIDFWLLALLLIMVALISRLTAWCKILSKPRVTLPVQNIIASAWRKIHNHIGNSLKLDHIQSTHSHYSSWRTILIISSHVSLRFSSGLFLSRFATEVIQYVELCALHISSSSFPWLYIFLLK